jgi:hypothetical protein
MAIKDLQTRVDQIFELTFGQIEKKDYANKAASQATRRLRRTLGSNTLECTIDASHIASTLRQGFEAKGKRIAEDYGPTKEGTLGQFGSALVDAFRKDRRYSGKKGETVMYKAGTGTGYVTVLKYTPGELLVFELGGFSRNDSSFAHANHTISQKLMDSPKFAPLFQGGKSKEYQEMAHEAGYGIVETKHFLIKGGTGAAGTDYNEQRYGGIDLSELPADPIRTKLQKIQNFKSNLILSAEHDIYVGKDGKVQGKTVFKGGIEAKWKNQKDAVAQAKLGQQLKDMLVELQETIKKEYEDKTKTTEELNSRAIVDLVGDIIVMSPIKRKAYASGRAVNSSKYNIKPKGKSPTKASKQITVTQKRQAIKFAGPTAKNTSPRVSPEKGEGTGKEDFAMQMRHLLKVKNAINKRLPAAVRANMARPALINRTGRFSNSVNVESIIPAAQTLMVRYNYRLNPYETFENKGRYKWPTGYNPKPLIAKSIRELAMGLVGQRLTIRRS